ncbi:hypothetical protein GGD83_002564 [Rhodoblastus sphagnicola]|nr:hypothetical protein [Rhodoblastus sphagnicola]
MRSGLSSDAVTWKTVFTRSSPTVTTVDMQALGRWKTPPYPARRQGKGGDAIKLAAQRSRYMTLETMAPLSDDPFVSLSVAAALIAIPMEWLSGSSIKSHCKPAPKMGPELGQNPSPNLII